MADGIVIPLDVDDSRAKAKVARLKSEAGAAGKAFGNASSQAARVGGAAGGALGRSIGGFQQGTGAGVLGLGLAGGGALLSAFLQRDGERMTMARDREARSQARAADARSVMRSKDDLAAGGLNFVGAARRLIGRGTSTSELSRQRQGFMAGNAMGLSTSEALMAMDAAATTGVNADEIMKGIQAGLGGAEETAGLIQKFNGLQNAVAATRNMSPSEAAEYLGNIASDPRSRNVNRAASALNPVAEAQLSSLFSGETAGALSRQANDTLNPGARLAAEAAQKALDTVGQLQAAAASQSALGAILAEMGRVVGLSEGSATRQLAVGAAAAAE